MCHGFACSAQVMFRLMWLPTIVLPGLVSSGCSAEVWNMKRLTPCASQ